MHETSIAQNLLDIILEKAKECNAKRITKITLKLGEFAGINQDSLKFAFENLTQKTIVEGVIVNIVSLPLLGKCRKCEKEFTINKVEFKCPKCGSLQLDIVSGEDLYVDNIEIE